MKKIKRIIAVAILIVRLLFLSYIKTKGLQILLNLQSLMISFRRIMFSKIRMEYKF